MALPPAPVMTWVQTRGGRGETAGARGALPEPGWTLSLRWWVRLWAQLRRPHLRLCGSGLWALAGLPVRTPPALPAVGVGCVTRAGALLPRDPRKALPPAPSFASLTAQRSCLPSALPLALTGRPADRWTQSSEGPEQGPDGQSMWAQTLLGSSDLHRRTTVARGPRQSIL